MGVDPLERGVRTWQLREDARAETGRGDLPDLTAASVVDAVTWPQG